MTGDRCRWIGAAGIVAVAVMRCCVAFVPQLVFDTDPALDNSPIAALGMGGSLLLDVALSIACLVALFGEWRSKRGLDPLLLLLSLLPLAVILWHGGHDAGNKWRGSTWFAAAIACVTIAHLARDRSMRIIITAALIAVVAPLLIRGAVQMTWEHDATVAAYNQSKDAFIRARGWDPDSSAVRIYERRLMLREPTGWFPSTNIYGSVMGAAAIMFAGLALVTFRAYRRRQMQSGAWFLMALLTLACAIALKFTTSMGAVLATIGGAIVLLLLVRSESRRPEISQSDPGQARGYVPRWLGGLMVVMIFGAMLGVIVRGSFLPEGFLHEKSLLFRWHYLQAAMGILSDAPLLGAGPSGFQLQYMLHRVPRNPEEVQSAHAMFTDWIATLGLLGGAWVAMIIALVVRSGDASVAPALASITSSNRNGAMQTPAAPPMLRFTLTAAMIALLPAIIIEWPALTPSDIFLRGLGVLGYITLALIVAAILMECDERWLRGLSAAAVVVLLVHGQIEMTFFQGGSVVWMMAMVGLIGHARPARALIVTSVCAALTSLVLLVFCGWTLWTGALPALAQERKMVDAARLLDGVRAEPSNRAVALRDRPQAAEKLVEAYELWPINNQPINGAVEQLQVGVEMPVIRDAIGNAGPPLGLLMRAEELADRAVATHDCPSSIVPAINVHAGLAALTDDAEQWNRAIALSRRMTEIDPQGVSAWNRLGDVLWAAGAKTEAADAYRTALVNSDNFALDEMKQLSAAKRTELQARINSAVATSQPDSK